MRKEQIAWGERNMSMGCLQERKMIRGSGTRAALTNRKCQQQRVEWKDVGSQDNVVDDVHRRQHLAMSIRNYVAISKTVGHQRRSCVEPGTSGRHYRECLLQGPRQKSDRMQ